MPIDRLLVEKREEILRIARRHGASNVRVFGSMARGDASPDSDVDLLVDVLPRHSSWFPGSLLVELEKALGRKVEIAEAEALHWYIRDRILAEAIPL